MCYQKAHVLHGCIFHSDIRRTKEKTPIAEWPACARLEQPGHDKMHPAPGGKATTPTLLWPQIKGSSGPSFPMNWCFSKTRDGIFLNAHNCILPGAGPLLLVLWLIPNCPQRPSGLQVLHPQLSSTPFLLFSCRLSTHILYFHHRFKTSPP